MEWDGDKVNDYFLKLFDHINTDHAENKRPKLAFFNSIRIMDYAYKEFYYKCARSSWTKERLLNALDAMVENEIDVKFDCSDYNADFRKSENYISLQRELVTKYKMIIETYSFNFDSPLRQHLSKDQDS